MSSLSKDRAARRASGRHVVSDDELGGGMDVVEVGRLESSVS